MLKFSAWKWPAQGTGTVPSSSAHFRSLSYDLTLTLLNVKIPLFVALNCTIEEQQYPTYEKARTDIHQAVTFDYVLQTRTTWLQRCDVNITKMRRGDRSVVNSCVSEAFGKQ